jgi:membrane protease YdiL (CAAX protease family)
MRMAISLAAVAYGLIPSVQLRPINPAEVVMLGLLFFIAAIPEELGWRGYALAKLLKGHTVWVASLMIGLMWGVVHLALHLPGMPSAGMPGYLTMLQLVGLSVILSWLYVRGGRNIVLTSIFHAAQSFFVIINQGLDQNQQVWLMAIVYCCAAAFLLITSRVMRHRVKFAGLGHPV